MSSRVGATLRVEHGVRDYDTWKSRFDGDPIGRESGGVLGYRIARSVEDPSRIAIDLDFASLDEAEAFRSKLQAMWSERGDELGLEDPSARIVETLETHAY